MNERARANQQSSKQHSSNQSEGVEEAPPPFEPSSGPPAAAVVDAATPRAASPPPPPPPPAPRASPAPPESDKPRTDSFECPKCKWASCPQRTGKLRGRHGFTRYRACSNPACGYKFVTFEAWASGSVSVGCGTETVKQ